MSVTVNQAVADKRPSIRPTVLVATLGTLLGAAAPAPKPAELTVGDMAAQVHVSLFPETATSRVIAQVGRDMVALGNLVGDSLYPAKPVQPDNRFAFLGTGGTLIAAASIGAPK